MNLTARSARGFVAAGLVGCLVWSMVVESAMPSWFDPDDSCPGVTFVEKHYFPPNATCVYEGGRVVEYIPVAKTVILTVLIVLLAVMTVTGLAVLGWQLLRHDQADVGSLKPGRPVRHVLGAAVLGIVTGEVARVVVIIALLMGGLPGGATALVAVALVAAGAASALDRAVGPGRDGSRRRGTVLVAAGGVAMIAVVIARWDVYEEHDTLLGPGWAIAVGAVVCAVVAGVQWLRVRE